MHRGLSAQSLGCALAVTLSGAAAAQPPEQPQLPQSYMNAASAWASCAAHYEADRLQTQIPAAALVEQAFVACRAEKVRLDAEAARTFGDAGKARMDRTVERYRAHAIAFINEKRAGVASSNPVAAWGECAGQYITAHARDAAPAPAVADAALVACANHEAIVRARLSASASGDQALRQTRSAIRAKLVESVNQMRSRG